MAKIWYSVQGDGLGHAVRSGIVIKELLKKKHSLIITACNKAYPYLKKKFGKLVHEIEGNSFVYENNRVNIRKSIQVFMKCYPGKSKKNTKRVFNLIKKFSPQVIVSDFEPVSHYFAFFFNIPIISLDNINILLQCRQKFDKKYGLLFLGSKSLINFFLT